PVAAAPDPRHQHFETGPQPQRDAAARNPLTRRRMHKGATAGRQHVNRLGQQPGNNPPLAVPEDALAAIGEDLLNSLAGGGLDLGIRIEKRQAEAHREATADLALAGAHQTNQDDRAARRERAGFRHFTVRQHRLDLRLASHRSFSMPTDGVLAYRPTLSSIRTGPTGPCHFGTAT